MPNLPREKIFSFAAAHSSAAKVVDFRAKAVDFRQEPPNIEISNNAL